MKFGGHQTFFIREGWLHKGLKLLIEDNANNTQLLTDTFSADYLGVGKNMAESIRHWLLALGLAKKIVNAKGKTTKELEPTELAFLIWKFDPYFINEGTLWILHINIVHNKNFAASWHWFFNDFSIERFEKHFCVDVIERKQLMSNERSMSRNTLDKDIMCMLNFYSRPIPGHDKDPEDSIECPFLELGLINHYKESGNYQINREKKKIHHYIFLYSLSLLFNKEFSNSEEIDIPFFDLIRLECAPNKVFQVNNETLFEMLLDYQESCNHGEIKILGLAGERQIILQNKKAMKWIEFYYSVTGVTNG